MTVKKKADGSATLGVAVDEEIKDTSTSKESKVKAVVDGWVSAHLRNSDFSRNTEAWNHLMKSLPKLVEGIVKEVM